MAFLMDEKERGKRGFVAVQVGLFANILLAILKTGVGILGNSSALLADGINSVSDVAYYLVVSIFIRLADKPPDDEHPYGHSQLESISAIVVGSFVITTAIAIFFNSVNKLYELVVLGKGDLGAAKYTLWIALFTILLKLLLMLYTNKVGKETNNPAVVALAYDHRNDLFAAIGVSVGIFLSQLGYYLFDPLAGALISFVVNPGIITSKSIKSGKWPFSNIFKLSKKNDLLCPVCKKKLVLGVSYRVDELADRPEGFQPKNFIPYKSLVELDKIIADSLGIKSRTSKKVMSYYENILRYAKNELDVLLNESEEHIAKWSTPLIAKGVMRVRENKVKLIILGCTELPLLFKKSITENIKRGIIDPMDILAKKAILKAGGKIK